MRTTRPRKTAAIVHKTDEIDHKNIELLEKCLTPQGEILSRRRTGLNTQRQRELKIAIKRARHLALIPFVA